MNNEKTASELYKSILYRAADIYQIEYEDIDRDFGNRFDPIIRFMSGALSSELERVYQHIDETEMRLQKRLARILLPDYHHLPQPAHALLAADTLSEPLIVNETVGFEYKTRDDEKHIAFSPVLTIKAIPAQVRVIATESQYIDVENRPRLKRRIKGQESDEIQRILIGFSSSIPITNWHGASLYFDIKGVSGDSAERAQFLSAVKKARCSPGKKPLNFRPGLPSNEVELEDKLNGTERYQKIVRARYENHFITFTEIEYPAQETESSAVKLVEWFSKMENFEITQSFRENLEESDRDLYWMEIVLNRPVQITQAAARLQIRFNVFPVANRRLNGHEKGGHHWLRNHSIKWIKLQPEDDFIALRKVYEESPPEYTEFVYKPFSEFKEEQRPSYTLRLGGIGRWDEYNAWHRMAYLVNLLQENFKQEELIEEAAGALSLEDIHHLLGKKIATSTQKQKPTEDIYVLLHTGNKVGVRARVEYWTSIGNQANGIPSKSRLICTSSQKSRFESGSIELVTSSTDGKSPLNLSEQLQAMKSVLLGRDRIVTREDLKDFCKLHLGEKVDSITIEDSVGTDPRYDFGMTRMIKISLRPNKEYLQEDWEGICIQVHTLIEQKSSSNIPYQVNIINN